MAQLPELPVLPPLLLPSAPPGELLPPPLLPPPLPCRLSCSTAAASASACCGLLPMLRASTTQVGVESSGTMPCRCSSSAAAW